MPRCFQFRASDDKTANQRPGLVGAKRVISYTHGRRCREKKEQASMNRLQHSMVAFVDERHNCRVIEVEVMYQYILHPEQLHSPDVYDC
jgi:hypothetical protein